MAPADLVVESPAADGGRAPEGSDARPEKSWRRSSPRRLHDTFPKTMRWGSGERVFVRPVRGLLALLGTKVVPMEILGAAAANVTRGHRILSDGEFAVAGPDDYLEKLRAQGVEPDGHARRRAILESARHLAAEVGGSISGCRPRETLADLWSGRERCAALFAPSFDLPEEITTTGDAHAPEVPAGARADGPHALLSR